MGGVRRDILWLVCCGVLVLSSPSPISSEAVSAISSPSPSSLSSTPLPPSPGVEGAPTKNGGNRRPFTFTGLFKSLNAEHSDYDYDDDDDDNAQTYIGIFDEPLVPINSILIYIGIAIVILHVVLQMRRQPWLQCCPPGIPDYGYGSGGGGGGQIPDYVPAQPQPPLPAALGSAVANNTAALPMPRAEGIAYDGDRGGGGEGGGGGGGEGESKEEIREDNQSQNQSQNNNNNNNYNPPPSNSTTTTTTTVDIISGSDSVNITTTTASDPSVNALAAVSTTTSIVNTWTHIVPTQPQHPHPHQRLVLQPSVSAAVGNQHVHTHNTSSSNQSPQHAYNNNNGNGDDAVITAARGSLEVDSAPPPNSSSSLIEHQHHHQHQHQHHQQQQQQKHSGSLIRRSSTYLAPFARWRAVRHQSHQDSPTASMVNKDGRRGGKDEDDEVKEDATGCCVYCCCCCCWCVYLMVEKCARTFKPTFYRHCGDANGISLVYVLAHQLKRGWNVLVPLDFLSKSSSLLAAACLLGALSSSTFNLLVFSPLKFTDNPFDTDTLKSTLTMCLTVYPLFLCTYHCQHIISNLLGQVFVGILLHHYLVLLYDPKILWFPGRLSILPTPLCLSILELFYLWELLRWARYCFRLKSFYWSYGLLLSCRLQRAAGWSGVSSSQPHSSDGVDHAIPPSATPVHGSISHAYEGWLWPFWEINSHAAHVATLLHRRPSKITFFKNPISFIYIRLRVMGFDISPRVVCAIIVSQIWLYQALLLAIQVAQIVVFLAVEFGSEILPDVIHWHPDEVRKLLDQVVGIYAVITLVIAYLNGLLNSIAMLRGYRRHLQRLRVGNWGLFNGTPAAAAGEKMRKGAFRRGGLVYDFTFFGVGDALNLIGYQVAYLTMALAITFGLLSIVGLVFAFPIVLSYFLRPDIFWSIMKYLSTLVMMWFVRYILQALQMAVARFLFRPYRGRLGIRHRRLFNVFQFFLLPAQMLAGWFSYIGRMTGALFAVIINSARVDRSLMVKGSERSDRGYRAYMAALLLDHYYNNSVLLVFCFLLLDCDPAHRLMSRQTTDIFNESPPDNDNENPEPEEMDGQEKQPDNNNGGGSRAEQLSAKTASGSGSRRDRGSPSISLQIEDSDNGHHSGPYGRNRLHSSYIVQPPPPSQPLVQPPYPQPSMVSNQYVRTGGNDLTRALLNPAQPPSDHGGIRRRVQPSGGATKMVEVRHNGNGNGNGNGGVTVFKDNYQALWAENEKADYSNRPSANRLRARTRWHLAMLLLFHPELIFQRKRYLTMFKAKTSKTGLSIALKLAASRMKDKIVGDMKKLTGWASTFQSQSEQRERDSEAENMAIENESSEPSQNAQYYDKAV